MSSNLSFLFKIEMEIFFWPNMSVGAFLPHFCYSAAAGRFMTVAAAVAGDCSAQLRIWTSSLNHHSLSLSLSLSASLLPLLRSKQSHQMMINFGKIISFFCKASDIFFQQPRMTTTSHRYVAFLRVGHSRPLFIYFRLFKRVDSKKVKKYSI